MSSWRYGHTNSYESDRSAHRVLPSRDMELGLVGKVSIVTGASQGIGREIALALAAEGSQLVISSRRQDALERVAKEVEEIGSDAEVVSADVTDPAAASAIVDAADARFGRIDVLVNNAGKGVNKPLLDLTDADWRDSFELNFLSAVRLSLACVPRMQTIGGGRIINIASRVGREPDPYFGPYGAAKAALINFSKALANAFSKEGILTNSVVPGLIRTEAVEESAERSAEATGMSVDEVFEATLRKRPIPAGRLGQPKDVAGLVAFLASDRASWITGSCFTVDGGIVRSAV
jgi:3-oxoacyl-[acyl-carrier protein] reductase